jgi:hypothetical protein
MTMQMLFAVTKPWTYWIAPPLLIVTLALVVVLAVGYYRKVMVLAYRWRIEDERRRHQRGRDDRLADVRLLHGSMPTTAGPMAA